MRSFSVAALAVTIGACSGNAGEALDGLGVVAFHAEAAALPDVKTDTGLQPANSPVQLQLTVTADAKTTIDATAHASGSSDAPVLTAQPGSGKLTVKGGFGLNARLVVSMKGLPSYDGPVPGIENSSIAFNGEATFEPYLLDGQFVTVAANIPAVNLPEVPLPGGLPGSLKIQVAEGSTVGAELRGTCAAIDGVTAQYTGTLAHSGNLVLKPSIELDIPLVGKKAYPLPDVKLPIAVPAHPIDIGSHEVTFGSAPAEGNVASVGRCDGTGGDASTTADAGIGDARPDAASATDGSADGAKPDASAPGTAAECAARAGGNRDSYIACCKENTQGQKEGSAIFRTEVCSVCGSECAKSYCTNGYTSFDATCESCFYSDRVQVSLTAAFNSKCTSEPCGRYVACIQAVPAAP